MDIFKNKFIIVLGLLISVISSASIQQDSVTELKNQILTLAQSYQGQGDPDQEKQKSLEGLVQTLVKENPMPSIKDRISILAGAWKQIWGPYEYRNNDGGVDPKIGTKEIYQVVFADGYYYNVAPYYPDKDARREQISLLRGKFVLDSEDVNGLRVKFTKYPGLDTRPIGVNLWDLAAMSEAGQLVNEITIVPTWIVKIFFGKGKLEEVYTDHDLRIVYGSSDRKLTRRSMYVMSRVSNH